MVTTKPKPPPMASVLITPITPPDEPETPPEIMVPKEKRRRAGKPKVRTGCVTCKIRRIKCDEQKPACQRCISTGRTCDGYKATTRPKATRKPGFSQQLSNITSASLSTTSSSSLTLLRPIMTTFPGDDMERHYIHRFLPIAEDVVGIPHIHNGFFWGHVVPEYCFRSPAVKHATVALSSAYHNFRVSGFPGTTSGLPTQTERFIIKQYNLALNHMAEELNGWHIRKRYGIIMICCVSFFYIEILRKQWPTAMMHLVNGIRLMSNLPDEVQDVFRHPEIFGKDTDNTLARIVYMMKLLRRWEGSASFIKTKAQPSLSLQAYETRKTECTVPKEVQSLDRLQEVCDDFYQDVNAFTWMCKQYSEDYPWDYESSKLQYGVLQQRSFLVGVLLEKAAEIYGEMEKAPKASEFLSYQGCLLRHRAGSLILDSLWLPQVKRYSPPAQDDSRYQEILDIAVTIKTALQTSLGPGASPWFNVDFGVVSTLYTAASRCRNPDLTDKLLDMMKNWPWREDLWDGPALREELIKLKSPANSPSPPAQTSAPNTPISLGHTPTTPELKKLAHRPPSRKEPMS